MLKISLLSSLFLVSTLCVNAEWQKTIKPFEPGEHPAIKPTKLTYEMSWNGAIKSGIMVIELGKKDDRYPHAFIAHMYGRSTGAAAVVFPYSFTYTSFSTLKQHKPILFVSKEDDDGEIINTKNTYKDSKVIHKSSTKIPSKNQVKTKDKTFDFGTVHDSVTCFMYLRSMPLKNGDVINLCLFPFTSPYYANITVLGREAHNGTQCIKLDIKLRKIDDKTLQLKEYNKLKKATMWISDDKQRLPMELRTEVFVGDVRSVLTKSEAL